MSSEPEIRARLDSIIYYDVNPVDFFLIVVGTFIFGLLCATYLHNISTSRRLCSTTGADNRLVTAGRGLRAFRLVMRARV